MSIWVQEAQDSAAYCSETARWRKQGSAVHPYPPQAVTPPLPDAPALLDSMRRGLVPLVRQGRRGPALDLDAFLLVVLEEYSDGVCGQGNGTGHRCPVLAARAGIA